MHRCPRRPGRPTNPISPPIAAWSTAIHFVVMAAAFVCWGSMLQHCPVITAPIATAHPATRSPPPTASTKALATASRSGSSGSAPIVMAGRSPWCWADGATSPAGSWRATRRSTNRAGTMAAGSPEPADSDTARPIARTGGACGLEPAPFLPAHRRASVFGSSNEWSAQGVSTSVSRKPQQEALISSRDCL